MTRQPVDRAHRPVLVSGRRWLTLHRRPVSGALAFLAVLLGLGALAPKDVPQAASTAGGGAALHEGERAVPLRIDDVGIAALLTPGDVVDVVGTDARGSTSLVASDVRVTSIPTTGSSWGDEQGGLVVVAAEPATALALAGAATRGSVTVTIHP